MEAPGTALPWGAAGILCPVEAATAAAAATAGSEVVAVAAATGSESGGSSSSSGVRSGGSSSSSSGVRSGGSSSAAGSELVAVAVVGYGWSTAGTLSPIPPPDSCGNCSINGQATANYFDYNHHQVSPEGAVKASNTTPALPSAPPHSAPCCLLPALCPMPSTAPPHAPPCLRHARVWSSARPPPAPL